VRVVTGPLECEAPELDPEPGEPLEPCEALVRVVTGPLECEAPELDPEPEEPLEPCDALVRVVTGVPDADEPLPLDAPAELCPLERVTTPATPAADPVLPECPCEPLAPVLTEPLPWGPRPPAATAPRGVGNSCRSWRTMWIVRRITCVRYWTAGARAATVATVLSAGCIA
jgi:hypothetical protein